MQLPKIVVEVGGGLVTNVYADSAVEIVIVDWDNIEAGDDSPHRLRFSDGTAVDEFMIADNQVA
ncbi:MAG: hypothetical protein E6H66_08625 [Betaproteobacteria bacterium]|nr:MAG: hypothetical protein E6H66_08625 [Betaproteobacteria bacterium]